MLGENCRPSKTDTPPQPQSASRSVMVRIGKSYRTQGENGMGFSSWSKNCMQKGKWQKPKNAHCNAHNKKEMAIQLITEF